MKPLDPDLESLLREWIEKAEADLEAAEQLAPSVASSFGAMNSGRSRSPASRRKWYVEFWMSDSFAGSVCQHGSFSREAMPEIVRLVSEFHDPPDVAA